MDTRVDHGDFFTQVVKDTFGEIVSVMGKAVGKPVAFPSGSCTGIRPKVFLLSYQFLSRERAKNGLVSSAAITVVTK